MRTCRLHLHAQTNAIWSNLNIQLNVCTYRHAHTHTRAHTGTHMGSGTLLAVEWRVTFANWQHLTWMLTHAQHQLSIWPWPAAGAVAAAAAGNRWPIEAPTSRQFPHFPAHTSMGTCAALRCVIEIRPSSKSVWVHSSIHSLSHTHALILWHTRQRRGAGICSCCCCVGNSNYDNLKCISVSSRKCCILFSAYRQTTFSPTIFFALTFHTCRLACEKLLGNVFV